MSGAVMALFNLDGPSTDLVNADYFFGIPTTLCGAIICAYYLTVRKYGLSWHFYAALPAITFTLALLLVSRVPLPKLAVSKNLAWNIFVFSNVAAAYVFGFMRIFPEYLLTIAGGYLVVASPFAVIRGVRAPQLRYNTASGLPERIEDDEPES